MCAHRIAIGKSTESRSRSVKALLTSKNIIPMHQYCVNKLYRSCQLQTIQINCIHDTTDTLKLTFYWACAQGCARLGVCIIGLPISPFFSVPSAGCDEQTRLISADIFLTIKKLVQPNVYGQFHNQVYLVCSPTPKFQTQYFASK